MSVVCLLSNVRKHPGEVRWGTKDRVSPSENQDTVANQGNDAGNWLCVHVLFLL